MQTSRRQGISLYALVFGSGFILMALEMLGSRLLAPHFGSSIYVWGSLITVFMTALSGGYYLGGILADKQPRQSTLTAILLAAGVLTAFIPTLSGTIAQATTPWGARAGALAAATAIFLPATIALGMVSPVAIKLGVTEMEQLGKTSGRLNAVSTVGSIFGTLITTFFLVPLSGTKLIITGLSAALFVLGAVSFLMERRRVQAFLTAVWAVFLVFLGPTGALSGEMEYMPGLGLLRTVYATESAYHEIRVMDGGGSRYLRFDRSWQSGMDLNDPFTSTLAYPAYFELAMGLKPDMEDILVIGLGGGLAPKKFWRDYPQVTVDAVELDPKVVEVAKEYFTLPEDPRLNVHVEDGRRFLETSAKKYDLIILDAYYSDAVPFHLTTREFMQSLSLHLKPSGVVAFNVIGSLEGEQSRFFRSLYKTAAEYFPAQFPVAVEWSKARSADVRRNILLFAASGDGLTPEGFKERIKANAANVKVPNLEGMLEGLYEEAVRTNDVPILTDDHAPVDNLIRVK